MPMYSLFGIGAYGAVRGGYLGVDYIVRVIKSQPSRYISNTNAPVFTKKIFSRENVEKGFYILGNGASNIVPTFWQWRDISKNKN